MRSLFLVLLILLVAAGAAWYLGVIGDPGGGLTVAETVYDTDADGRVDLRRRVLGDQGALWLWDRDGDEGPELTAYDVTLGDDGELHRTGSFTAWDFGSDGLLEQGQVPSRFQEILAGPEMAAALAAAAPAQVKLVDARVRELVESIEAGYDDWRLSGLRMPIVGAGLPDRDNLLPGAERTYRFGIHQGFDMYPGHVGVPTGYGGPVVAAKDGTVIRADLDYVEMTPEQYAAAIARSRAARTTPAEELDLLRGRQVWIDHGNGIVTRYAHLSGIAAGIGYGQAVEAGAIIGYVGNSGTEAATVGSDSGAHLHFELRIDGNYLGEGMPPDAIRALAAETFQLPVSTPTDR